MNGDAKQIINAAGDLATSADTVETVQKKAQDGSVLEGVADIAGDLAESTGSDIIEGVVDVAGNVLGGVLDAAGDLLGGIFS